MSKLIVIIGIVSLLNIGSVSAEPRDHCQPPEQRQDQLACITLGMAWVTMGGPTDDTLVGIPFNDIIHSGKGYDVIFAGKGYDVCYVQPVDVAKGCEKLV